VQVSDAESLNKISILIYYGAYSLLRLIFKKETILTFSLEISFEIFVYIYKVKINTL